MDSRPSAAESCRAIRASTFAITPGLLRALEEGLDDGAILGVLGRVGLDGNWRMERTSSSEGIWDAERRIWSCRSSSPWPPRARRRGAE